MTLMIRASEEIIWLSGYLTFWEIEARICVLSVILSDSQENLLDDKIFL